MPHQIAWLLPAAVFLALAACSSPEKKAAKAQAEAARQFDYPRFDLELANLEEISAEPERQPDRVDWKLVYKDAAAYPLDRGEARIAIQVAGRGCISCTGSSFIAILRTVRCRRPCASARTLPSQTFSRLTAASAAARS